MFRVPGEQITGWESYEIAAEQVLAYPTAARVTCPHCAIRVGFNLEGRVTREQVISTAAIPCPCPNCGVEVRFFVLDPTPDAGEAWQGELWVHPAPVERHPLVLEGLVPARVVGAYQEVNAAYGYHMWRAAAQQGRVVLEGVVKTLLVHAGVPLGDVPGNLSQAMLLLARNHDLGAPIQRLGDALRAGGNLASHFDDRGDVTEEMASEILDLLDSFIEYFIILPNRVDGLMTRLDAAPAVVAPEP